MMWTASARCNLVLFLISIWIGLSVSIVYTTIHNLSMIVSSYYCHHNLGNRPHLHSNILLLII